MLFFENVVKSEENSDNFQAFKGLSHRLPCGNISRKVVGKNVRATIPKGNVGYEQYFVPDDCSCRTYLCCFPSPLANICPWPLLSFFQISLKNSELKTTHNTRVEIVACTFSDNLSRNSCMSIGWILCLLIHACERIKK